MARLLSLAALIVVATASVFGVIDSPLSILASAAPLDDYVYTDDGEFSVTDMRKQLRGDGFTAHLFNFTSQRWMTPSFSSAPLWWHVMAVIIPDIVDPNHDSSYLYINGGNNDADYSPSLTNFGMKLAGEVAVRAKTTATVLFHVPNEPMSFPADPWKQPKRTEDGIIAYTWWAYATSAAMPPEVILEFPMTKAGVKAMDALQSIIPALNGGRPINSFTVAGCSKRGWTTWLVGAVEAERARKDNNRRSRVVAIIPMVLDALDIEAYLHRQHRFYGAWTNQLQDYVDANITLMLDTPRLREVFELVDPWYFRERLTMPKLILSAGGDEFLMPDDTRYFGKDFPKDSETKFLLVKNAGHSLNANFGEVTNATVAFVSSVQAGAQRPTVEWSYLEESGRIYVRTSQKPLSVNLIYCDSGLGDSTGKRDFRWSTLATPDRKLPWVEMGEEHVVFTSETAFNALIPTVAGRWRVFTLEIQFEQPAEVAGRYTNQPLLFTVPASVVPNTFPFPDCSGESCGKEMC